MKIIIVALLLLGACGPMPEPGEYQRKEASRILEKATVVCHDGTEMLVSFVGNSPAISPHYVNGQVVACSKNTPPKPERH